MDVEAGRPAGGTIGRLQVDRRVEPDPLVVAARDVDVTGDGGQLVGEFFGLFQESALYRNGPLSTPQSIGRLRSGR